MTSPVWPFSRLVDARSVPVGYLRRRLVVYRSRSGRQGGRMLGVEREGRPTLHFGYHLVFFVGLGGLTALGAARLGRVAGWTVLILAVCTGILYSAGVG